MNKTRDDLFRNVIDLNDIIAFEYDCKKDVISFSDNIARYIPVSCSVLGFTADINNRGKIHMFAFLIFPENFSGISSRAGSGNRIKAVSYMAR